MTTIVAVENVTNLTTVSDDNVIISVDTPTILQVVDDSSILISESITREIIHTGILGPTGADGPVAGITDSWENLVFIGSGTGASKTTTKIEGDVIFESFGIGDEIYLTWVIPEDIERNYPEYLTAHMFSETSEVGTFTSWEIGLTAHNSDGTHVVGTLFFIDAPMPETAFEPTNGTLEIPAGVYIGPLTSALHIRVKRISSSNDTSAAVGIMALFANYTSDGRVGATGAEGAPGGEDEVAQAKRVDFTVNDTIIYKGEALPGTPDATSIWRVRRLTIASDNDVTEEWADGTADYIKVWDDRYTYTYS